MKRLTLLAALLALVIVPALVAQSTLRRTYEDLEVDVWTDRDDGSNYYEGDEITIYFRASRDCYVTIYDLDTRGNVNLVFPEESDGNHFVHGDEIYMVPERGADYALTVEGPPGNEQIQMVASTEYFPVPDWRGPVSVYDKSWGFKYDGDDEEFIQMVNRHNFPGDNVAFDNATFYVAPKYYYKPVRAECAGNCGVVYIDYPNGCDVYLDGVFYGYAPLYIPAIYLGRHRVVVYWSGGIVYNDWIFVDPFAPFFVYTRPYWVYNYCYDHWYRDYVWDDYHHGPSRYKYKSADFYKFSRPEPRRGFEVVVNDHAKYVKSKTYVTEKTSRITKYKETYGFDAKGKTYMTTKSHSPTETVKKRIYNDDAYTKPGGKGSDVGREYEKKGTAEKRVRDSQGYEKNRGSSSGERESYKKKQSDDSGSKGKSDSGVRERKKSSGSSGGEAKKGQATSAGKKSTSGETKSKSGGGSYRVSPPASKPSSGGSSTGKASSGGSAPKHSGATSGGKKSGR